MILPLRREFDPTSTTRPPGQSVGVLREGAPRPRGGANRAMLATLFGFVCFLPYPAISVGNNSAIQVGNVLTLLMCLPSCV